MKPEFSRSLHRLKRSTPFVFGAALAINALLNPSPVAAQTDEPLEGIVYYPRCGNENAPHTNKVFQTTTGSEIHTREYDMGIIPGDCGNFPGLASSIILERVRRSLTHDQFTVTDRAVPLGCPSNSSSFRIDTDSPVEGISFEPDSGQISANTLPRIGLRLDMDKVSDGEHIVSGKAICVTSEGFNLEPKDKINIAVVVEK